MNTQLQLLKVRHWSKLLYTDNVEQFRQWDSNTDLVANNIFDDLAKRYQEPHRKYHNINHLDFLFALDSEYNTLFSYDFQLYKMLFFFFHDAIYNIDPANPVTDNESKSALYAGNSMYQMGFTNDSFVHFVSDTIELSNHTTAVTNIKQQYVLDCDLAILGAESQVYQQYVADIREEYGTVSDEIWAEKRGLFLEFMLNKGNIFNSDMFNGLYGLQAQQNLRRELDTYK